MNDVSENDRITLNEFGILPGTVGIRCSMPSCAWEEVDNQKHNEARRKANILRREAYEHIVKTYGVDEFRYFMRSIDRFAPQNIWNP